MATHTFEVKTNLNNLMVQAANQCGNEAILLGFQIADGHIRNIAERAIEIMDEDIIHHLEIIGYISITETKDENSTLK